MNELTQSVQDQLVKTQRKSILSLSHMEAREFLLKAETYSSVDLPPYFVFGDLIAQVHAKLDGKTLSSLSSNPRDFDDVNYTILNNKDGKYAWRPFQLINPALYVSLVHRITEESNWSLIIKRFDQFSANKKIHCLSLPIVSHSDEKDKAEQVSHWWYEVCNGQQKPDTHLGSVVKEFPLEFDRGLIAQC